MVVVADKNKKQWKDLKPIEKLIGYGIGAFVIIAIIMGLSGAFDDSEEEIAEREARQEQREQDKADKKAAKEEEKAKIEEEKKAEKKKESEEKEVSTEKEDAELTQDEKIKQKITKLAEDEPGIKINKIDVVENHSDESDGGYNALVHLVFDVQNKANTAKGAINANTDSLGSSLAGTEGLENVTFFWEVPYLLEGNNIIKINAEQKDGKMYRVDEWFDGRIFE